MVCVSMSLFTPRSIWLRRFFIARSVKGGRSMEHVTFLDIIIILAYLLGMLWVGLYFTRRVKTSSDFFVAGRTLGPVVLMATVSSLAFWSASALMDRMTAAGFSLCLCQTMYSQYSKRIRLCLTYGTNCRYNGIRIIPKDEPRDKVRSTYSGYHFPFV